MAEKSRARICDRSLVGVAGSKKNPVGGLDVSVVCVVQQGQKAKSRTI